MKAITQTLAFTFALALPALGEAAQLTVTAVNKAPIARARQTIELTAKQLELLGTKELNIVHVKNNADQELLCQAVETDVDAYGKADLVIFQADFAASETKTFTVTTGAKQEFVKDQFKAFGRFVPERCDDFAWENDRIAHRTYGKALESWAADPLTSSTIDIWSKRTSRLVINDWYLANHYHEDSGEGADYYSAGRSRGCGGNGLWAADQLWTSKNFVGSRVLANGPIRVLFELDYEMFEVNGIKVREVKRVALDGGSQLNHLQSIYELESPGTGKPTPLTSGLGLKKVAGARKSFDAATGTLVVWEKAAKNAGMQGLAVVVDPKAVEREAEDKLNHLVLAKCGTHNSVSYWTGFAWDQAGQITTAEAWKKYVDEFAQGVASPILVSVAVGEK